MPRKLALPHAAKAKGIFTAVLKEHGQDHLADHHWDGIKGHVEEALVGAISRAGQKKVISVRVKARPGVNAWQTLMTEEVSTWDIHSIDGSRSVEHREEVHLLFHSNEMPGGGQKWNFAAFYKDADANHYARHYPGQGWGDEARPATRPT